MAKRTRLGYEGYGVRRAGSFSGKVLSVIVLSQLAKVSAVDREVTVLAIEDGVVTVLAIGDRAVTRVTLTEWPS